MRRSLRRHGSGWLGLEGGDLYHEGGPAATNRQRPARGIAPRQWHWHRRAAALAAARYHVANNRRPALRGTPMPRPICATIDLSSLRNNLAVARAHAGSAKVWCVVKADAYGHGLDNAVRAWRDLADGFALLDLDLSLIHI